MSLVIVTPRQYILASKIYDITLNETYENMEYRNMRGKLVGFAYQLYSIKIIYTPANQNPNLNREDVRECTVVLNQRMDAHNVYQDLIRQIREQMPDELYLDKAFEHLLTISDEKDIQNSLKSGNLIKMEDLVSDRRSKKVRRVRKAKRRSKKVLRKSKASNRGRRR